MISDPEREILKLEIMFLSEIIAMETNGCQVLFSRKTGLVSYRVKLTDGIDRRCQKDQVHKHSVEVPRYSQLEPEIPDTDLPSSEVTVPSNSNTEHSTSNTISETTSTESSTNTDPASSDPVSIDTDATEVNPTPNTAKVYSRAPVVRFEPTWT